MDESLHIDVSLLAHIAQRDAQALEAFYLRHADRVYALAHSMLRDWARAADLTQEVFLLVWRNAGAYQPTGSARAWLLRMTRNRAIDYLRHDRRRSDGELILADEMLSNMPPLTEQTDHIERQAVRKAVENLPGHQREALFLAFFLGMSHQEIATHMDLPLGTVKARIRRALHVLRRGLHDEPTA
jgi:RNA polymerase sigma-70 factor (ECF subfamily)